jgi:thiamine-phosphate pyrophosphorylase
MKVSGLSASGSLRDELLLYAVTDRSWLGGRTLATVVEEALQGGVTLVQLREKELEFDAFVEEARIIHALCRRWSVRFIINDAVEVARVTGADGVHVGQGDMPAAEVRALLGPNTIVGVSVATVEEALKAQADGADYLGVGAVFATGTKTDGAAVPRETLRAICAQTDLPVCAIGGINEGNILELADSGIDGVAVVSAIFAAADIPAATRRLRNTALEATRPQP